MYRPKPVYFRENKARRKRRIIPVKWNSQNSGDTILISPLARRALWLKARHEMVPVGLGERFSFALERDDSYAPLKCSE